MDDKEILDRWQVAEDAFRERIKSASALAADFDTVLPRATFPRTAELAPAHYPSLTLRRLEIAARVQFSAGLQLLMGAWTAYAAELQARALLEVLANVAWITGHAEADRASTPQCRALRLERGLVEELEANLVGMKAVAPNDVSAAEERKAAEQRTLIDRLFRESGCRGRSRKLSHVTASIRALRRRHQLPPWMDNLYDLLSRAVHGQVLDRMMREGDRGLWFGGATHGQRAWSLTWLVLCYGQTAAWTIAAEDSEDAAATYLARVQAIIDDNWLDEARLGKADEQVGYPPVEID